jgi:RecA/RadA recombinase
LATHGGLTLPRVNGSNPLAGFMFGRDARKSEELVEFEGYGPFSHWTEDMDEADAELDNLVAGLKKKGEDLEPPIDPKDLLSTGSTLLDLALSGNPRGGLCRGRYFFFVGDSSSGKTFFCLTCFAEAARRKSFDEYKFVHNNVEDGALMDFTRYFGAEVAARVESPCLIRTEDMYDELYDRLTGGQKVIWVNDSTDAMTTEAEDEEFVTNKKLRQKGKDSKGTYGMSKAKSHSVMLRQIIPLLKTTGSILINIAQTRDNIDPVSPNKKTRAGGRALRFYAHGEMWTSLKGGIKKSVRDNDLKVGNHILVEIKKNRLTGKEWKVEVPIYFSYGIDDIESCIDYLVQWKHWKKADSGGTITAVDWPGLKGTKAKIIEHVEQNNLEKELKQIVAAVWAEVEEAVRPERKPRYQ